MGCCCRRGEHGSQRRRSQTLRQAMRRSRRIAANGSQFPLTPLPHSARPMPLSLRHPGCRSRRFLEGRRSPHRKSRSRPLLIVAAPRVRTRRRSDFAGQEQTPPQPGQVFSHDHASSQSQRQSIAQRSEGDDFDPSETPRKSKPSTIQDEQAHDLANELSRTGSERAEFRQHACSRADSSRDLALTTHGCAVATHCPYKTKQRRARTSTGSPRAGPWRLHPRASVSGLAEVDRRSQTDRRPPRTGCAGVVSSSAARLDSRRGRQRVAAGDDSDCRPDRFCHGAGCGDRRPRRAGADGDKPDTRRTRPVSAAHPLSPAPPWLRSALQSAPPQQAIPDGPAPEQAASVLRPALRSARQETSGEPWPTAARTSARAGAGPDNAPAPVQQTIHVTIGRIEVRATPPPSAPARKQNAAPVMSLDEYLKTRSGGQR